MEVGWGTHKDKYIVGPSVYINTYASCCLSVMKSIAMPGEGMYFSSCLAEVASCAALMPVTFMASLWQLDMAKVRGSSSPYVYRQGWAKLGHGDWLQLRWLGLWNSWSIYICFCRLDWWHGTRQKIKQKLGSVHFTGTMKGGRANYQWEACCSVKDVGAKRLWLWIMTGLGVRMVFCGWIEELEWVN